MRVIIESDKREGVVKSVHEPSEPTATADIDGGAPSEELTRSMAETGPVLSEAPTGEAGIDAGPPPDWLLRAIEGAVPVAAEVSPGGSDGGPAPAEE